MNFDELKDHGTKYIEKNRREDAITCFEKMLSKYPDKQESQKYQLILANLYFVGKSYASADKYYERYTSSNPGNSEYTAYRSVLCKYYQVLDKNRNQLPTKRALVYARGFLDNPNYAKSKYAKKVKDIAYSCEKRQVDHEVYVFNFYIKRGQLKSAEKRIEDLRKNYLGKFPELEPQLVYLQAKLAKYQGKREDLSLNKKFLADKFPQSHFTAMAQKLSDKKEFLFF